MHKLTEWDSECLNSDWIKVAGWDRTFSNDEHRLLKTFKGCSGVMCAWVWLLQREYRPSHGALGTEVVADPGLHEALLLMRAAGIPCDRMRPDDDWEFPEYMKEPVP